MSNQKRLLLVVFPLSCRRLVIWSLVHIFQDRRPRSFSFVAHLSSSNDLRNRIRLDRLIYFSRSTISKIVLSSFVFLGRGKGQSSKVVPKVRLLKDDRLPVDV
jgi:hypothetical protein